MKIRHLIAIVGLVISFAVPAFAQQKDTVEPEIAEQIRALATKFDRVEVVGDGVRAIGTWSCTFQDDSGHTKHIKGQVTWVLVHEGDTWKIREDTYDQSDPY